MNGGREEGDVDPPGPPAPPQAQIVRRGARGGGLDGGPAADVGQRPRDGDREPGEQHNELDQVHPGRGHEAAGAEVGDDDDSAHERAHPAGGTGDDRDDLGHGDELPGHEGERGEPEQHGDQQPDGAAVPQVEVVAHGEEPVARGHLPDARSDPEGKQDRPDTGRADPPPRAQPVAVAESRRAHRRARPEVGGQHGGEEQHGPKLAVRHEETPRPRQPAARSTPPAPRVPRRTREAPTDRYSSWSPQLR